MVKSTKGFILPLLASGDYQPTNVDIDELFKLIDEHNGINIQNDVVDNEELLINASHELRTPLNIIYGAVQLLEVYTAYDCNKPEKIAFSINSIKQNSFRLMKIINNMLDLHRVETGLYEMNYDYVNIVGIVEDVVQRVSKALIEKHMKFIFDTECEEKYMLVDVEKIERVLLNLLSNAVKYTETGGIISVNMYEKDNYVEIKVSDTGIGIEKKYLDDIFNKIGQVDKSLSRMAEGLGMGLNLSKALLEAHGGTLYVYSNKGKGSTFVAKLPCRKNDTIYTLYSKKVINYDNLNEMIKIEFSDIDC